MQQMLERADRQEALAYIRHAIALCDRLGEPIAACHLQLGADLLEEKPEDQCPSGVVDCQ